MWYNTPYGWLCEGVGILPSTIKETLMIGFILYLLVIGLVAGFIARAIVPGNDSMSVMATIVLGIIGSFIGGFIGYLITHKDETDGAFQASGIIGSIVGAIVALLVYRAVGDRSRRTI